MTDPRDPGFLAVAFFLICHLLAHVLALAMPTVRESAKVGQAEEFSALELSLAAKPNTSKSKTKAPPPPAEDNSSDPDVVEVKEEPCAEANNEPLVDAQEEIPPEALTKRQKKLLRTHAAKDFFDDCSSDSGGSY